MKKIALLVFIASSSLAMADNLLIEDYDPEPMVKGNSRVDEIIEWNNTHPGEMPPLTEQEKYEIFIKHGVPVPGSGAQVIENKNIMMSAEQGTVVKKFNLSQKAKGYYEEYNPDAKRLLNAPTNAKKEYQERRSIKYNPLDTHLYKTKNTLKMSYDYRGVRKDIVKEIIGYSPESTYIPNGWTGAVVFFIPNFDAVCAYHEVNIVITKSTASIPKEVATYTINNKITTINAIGTDKSGYAYNVEWWDKAFRKNLECATKFYSENIKQNVINLAKDIDKG